MKTSKPSNAASVIALISILCGCTDGHHDGASADGTSDVDTSVVSEPVLISRSEIVPFGSMHCPASGDVTYEGYDSNGDGDLSLDEIESTEYLCQETSEAELGLHRHTLSFAGNAIVHHRLEDRATGKVLVEAWPFGQGHVGRADHIQEFTNEQLRAFHDLMTGRVGSESATTATTNELRMRSLGRGSTLQAQAGSAAADSVNNLYHAGSITAGSTCEEAYSAGDTVCGLAVGADPDQQVGQLSSSAGCFWMEPSATSAGTTLKTGLTSMDSGKTVSDNMNISGKVSASYGAFSGSDKFSYSSSYNSSSYGGSQSFQNYYLATPHITVSETDPYVTGRSSDTVAQDLNCGTEYQTTPTIGMVVGGTMTYQFDSESSSSTYENTVKMSYGKGMTSVQGDMSTTVSKASSDTSSTFDFTVTLYGGGPAASMFVELYGENALGSSTPSDTSDDFYTKCFSESNATACTSFFSAVDAASTASLAYLGDLWTNQWAATPDSTLPAPTRDISFMATFPDGYDGVYSPSATTTVPTISSSSRNIGATLKDRLPLLNELSTLSLRVQTMMESEAAGTSGELNLEAELSSLQGYYDQDRALVLAAVQQCLLGKNDSTASNDCTGMDILSGKGITSAYEYYNDAYNSSTSAMDQLMEWYTSVGLSLTHKTVSSAQRLSARENTVVLPLSGSLSACTRGDNPYLCSADFKAMQNATMVAVWLQHMPTTTTTPTAIQGGSGVVVFPLVDYQDNINDTAALNSGGQIYWVLVDQSATAKTNGIAKLFNALTGTTSGSNAEGNIYRMKGNAFESAYEAALVEINNDNANSCTDFSMSSSSESPSYCQLSLLLDWSENDETARWVTPKYVTVSDYIDNGDNEKQIWPPECTWTTVKNKTCRTEYVMTGFGSSTGGNDVHYLAARYTNLNRLGFGAKDRYGDIIAFTDDTVGDQVDFYTDTVGVVSGEKKVLLDASSGQIMTGFGVTSQDSKVTHVGAYYRTVDSYTNKLYDASTNLFNLSSLTSKVVQDPVVNGATTLSMEVNVPGNSTGVIMAMALRVKNGDEKAASYAWGRIALDVSQLPKSTLTLTREASFYNNN